MSSISIVIPAYNEAESINWVVKNTAKNLPKYFKSWEIIVVDDGSNDQTGAILDKLTTSLKNLKVIHQKNQGYSGAMLSGIKAAKKDYTAYLPADGQFLVSDMRHCFDILKDNDLVLGYRGSRPDYSKKRLVYSYGYLLLLLFLFDIKWIDVGWVNIWRTKQIQKLRLNGNGGIFILTETVVKFMKKGLRISEGPSYYRVRRSGEVKNAKFKVVWNTFLSALSLKLQMLNGKI